MFLHLEKLKSFYELFTQENDRAQTWNFDVNKEIRNVLAYIIFPTEK